MLIWFDTEFIDDGRTIDLLSIGMVNSRGRELYLEIAGVDCSKAVPWVRENVLIHLGKGPIVSREEAKRRIIDFVGDEQPEFWAYYASYDWVALCQLFGTMLDVPRNWPHYCNDLKQMIDDSIKLPKQVSIKHHALEDARWVQYAWEDAIRQKLIRDQMKV